MNTDTASSTSASDDFTLEHVFLFVKDLDASLRFYRALFPMWSVRWDGGKEQRWIHFGGPVAYVSLCQGDGPRAHGEHFGFRHRDVAALEARCQSAGIEVTDRADDGKYRRIYVTDPDGHEIEFVQALS